MLSGQLDCLTGQGTRQMMNVEVSYEDGTTKTIECLCRVDTEDELEYIKAGGILHYVLRNLVTG